MKGEVLVELRDKDGNIKKVVTGHNAICSHMNTAAYTQLVNQYTAPDNYKDDIFFVPNHNALFSGPSAFQTLYLSDARESLGAKQMDVPGNILATCPFANTTENIATNVGAWDSVYSHRSLKSVTRAYRFGQETFAGVVGTIGWMSDSSTRKDYLGLSICCKRNIQYVQYIGDGKLLIVAYTSDPYLVNCPEGIAAITSSGSVGVFYTNYCQIDVGYFLVDIESYNYSKVAEDVVYWYSGSGNTSKGSPSTSIYSCDGRYVYFYDGHFRRTVIDLLGGIVTKNEPRYSNSSGTFKLMVHNNGSSGYTAISAYFKWTSDGKTYYVRPALYSPGTGSYSSAGGGDNRQRHVYVNNDVLYLGNSNTNTLTSTSYSCNIVSAVKLPDNYLGCGLYDCYIADGVSNTNQNFVTRKFYLGTSSWSGWFCVGGENIYLFDTVGGTIKKMSLSSFMSELEACTIGNDVYLDLSTLENAKTTTITDRGQYICDEFKYMINMNLTNMQGNGYGNGIMLTSWNDTRCTSVYVLNEPLQKTYDDTLTVKYTISFDPAELLV